jgi:hypothetical protein
MRRHVVARLFFLDHWSAEELPRPGVHEKLGLWLCPRPGTLDS